MKFIFSFLIVGIVGVHFCYAQPDDTWFPFEIPALDTSEVEFAPVFPQNPIGNNDFVSINSAGHFEVNGEEIRFWGTPIYPFKADKELVKKEARELRKMGVNMVRFHLIDSREWAESDIFGTKEGTRTLDPVQLERMDYMVSELKKQGIYVYMDLLCGRKYTESDGVYDPDSVFSAAKEVNFFDPYLIELQKEYASQLLTHVNPYTGLALKDDPVMACMEIVNEGWFLHSVRCDKIKPVSEGGLLSHYHYNMLVGFYNDFLEEKYGTHEELMNAWGIIDETSLSVANNGFENDFENWNHYLGGQVQGSMEIDGSDVHSGDKALHLNITESSSINWECNLEHDDLFFTEGESYTLSFWAKSEDSDTVHVNIAQRTEPYTSVGGGQFIIEGDWKEYELTFTVNQVWEDDPHFAFYMGLVKGNLWLDDISITEGASEISDGGTLDDRNIKLLGIWEKQTEPNRQRQLDQSEFYLKIQSDYYTDLSTYLKDDIGVKIPVAGSNYLVGIPDFYVQDYTDFVDQHGYWGLMSNDKTSMISNPNFTNAILDLFAGVGVQGKPLTASEYNYEMPNSFANEALFFLAAYSSFQDADMALVHGTAYERLYDGIMLSGLDNYNRLFDKVMYPGFAYVYRNKLISKAETTVNIGFTDEDVKNLVFHKDELWETAAYPNDYPFELMYKHGLRSSFNTEQPYNVNDYPARPTNPYRSDTEEIEWDENGLFSINTSRFVAIVGKMNEYAGKEVGVVEIVEADKSCGLTLLTLDDKSINQSEKMLMTFTTQQGTMGMVIEDGTVTDHGVGPILLEPATIKFKLKTELPEIKVHWLAEEGNPTGYYEVFDTNDDGTATIEINTYERDGLWFGIGDANATSDLVNVTFSVDMQSETVSQSGIFLRGTFNSWNSNTPLSANGTVYSTTLQLNKGETVEYKFVNGDTWEDISSGTCTTGEDRNRSYTVPDSDVIISAVCFNSCEACNNTGLEDNYLAQVKVYPNPAKDKLTISGLGNEENMSVKIYSLDGRLLLEQESTYQTQVEINLDKYNQGVYKLVLTSNSGSKSFSIVKQGRK